MNQPTLLVTLTTIKTRTSNLNRFIIKLINCSVLFYRRMRRSIANSSLKVINRLTPKGKRGLWGYWLEWWFLII